MAPNGNPRNAISNMRQDGINIAQAKWVIYDLGENHIVGSSDDMRPGVDPRTIANRYQLDNADAQALHREGNFAVLAYVGNDVYKIDVVPELQIAACVLLDVVNVLAGEGCNCGTTQREYVPATGPARDSRGRFIKGCGCCGEEDREEEERPCSSPLDFLKHRSIFGDDI